jgi:glycosyltransferase involved in cell wall biosynthesis
VGENQRDEREKIVMRKVTNYSTYNRAAFFTGVASVLASLDDFAIIVVDDGGDNTTKSVVNSFGDPRLRYVRNEKNMGEGRSRNVGISNSTAEYIAFLDDDDEWLPEKLQLQVDLLESQPVKVGGVYTSFTAVEVPSGEILYHRIVEKRGDVYQQMVQENVVGTSSTVLLRRECFERVGPFDESIPYGLDYDMWIRISKEFHFECIEQSLVKYHVHEGQLTNDLERFIAGQEALLTKYDRFFASDRKSYSDRYAGLGLLYREKGDLWRAWQALLKAIKIDPSQKKNYHSLWGYSCVIWEKGIFTD